MLNQLLLTECASKPDSFNSSSIPLSYDFIHSYAQMLQRALQQILKMIMYHQYSAKKPISVTRAPLWNMLHRRLFKIARHQLGCCW